MSRKELAALVNAWIFDRHQRETAIDANYIGKLERGLIRWPDALYREGFRAVLGEGQDRALGFRRPRRTSRTIEDVNRQDFLRATAGVSALVVTGSLSDLAILSQPSVPSTVGQAEIDQLRTAARIFGNVDHTYGGGMVRQAVGGQLRYAVELLSAPCPQHLRDDLFAAVGFLGHTAGAMAFDAYAHEDARRMFSLALSCAEESGNWHLRAKVLSTMARQAIWRGDPDMGLTLIDVGFIRSERLTPTERAMLYTGRARANAKLGRVPESLRAVGMADAEFAHANPTNDPAWMVYYDTAQHVGDTGHALFDLATLDSRYAPEAATRLGGAVKGHSATYARSRALSQIKLASLTMTTGDPHEAALIGGSALDSVGKIQSRRLADEVRELSRFATKHRRVDQVAHLRQRIDTIVQPA
ncbi:hypothetical protein KBI5_23320 [Frankia sp. KB5]|nr:hypothetical protein KBI5_23320 [Frankia sp. KB5]